MGGCSLNSGFRSSDYFSEVGSSRKGRLEDIFVVPILRSQRRYIGLLFSLPTMVLGDGKVEKSGLKLQPCSEAHVKKFLEN